MNLRLSALGLAVALASCANPGIVPMSQDTYMLTKTDRAGIFGNAAAMKAEVIQEANAFAASKGKVAVPIAANETPMAPGRFASFEYQFRLVDVGDPAARGGALLPRPNTVIENTGRTTVEVKAEPARRDVYAELIKLDDLRKRGVLTDAEFAAEKQKLLGQ